MDLVGDRSTSLMDSMIDPTLTFRSPSEFRTTLVTSWVNKGAGRLNELSWHVGSEWGYWMINIIWQELVRGGGIDRRLGSAMYGDEGLPWIYVAHGSLRSSIVVIFPWAQREIFLSDLSGRIGREGSLVRGYGDVIKEMAILKRYKLLLTGSDLDHDIQGSIRVCSDVQRQAWEYKGSWWYVVVRRVAQWSRRSDLHRSESPCEVIDAST